MVMFSNIRLIIFLYAKNNIFKSPLSPTADIFIKLCLLNGKKVKKLLKQQELFP